MLDGQLVKWQLQFVNQIADTFAQSCENTRPQKQQRDNKDGENTDCKAGERQDAFLRK